MRRLFIIILIFESIIWGNSKLFGQPKDVEGWSKAQWGMTEEQILEIFKGEVVRLDKVEFYENWYASIGINNLEIGGDKFYVHFLMNKKKKTLQQVNIIAKEEALQGIEVVFEFLEQLLVEKYGKPSFKNEEEYKGRVIWNFPTTVIELSYLVISEINFKKLTIIYHPPRKDDLKKI